MRFSITALASLLAFSTAAHAVEYIRCADSQPDSDFTAESERISNNITTTLASASISVGIYAHVVTTSGTKGRYSNNQIHRQVSVMNHAYNPYGVKFYLISISHTVNNAWASTTYGTSAEHSMKHHLHRGDYANLNLYFLSNLDNGQGLLGQCYFPVSGGRHNPSVVQRDGCILLADSLPGGRAAPYNKGITAVHETGHWFGLYHPFQGESCSGPGDYISDTPQQSTPTFGCPSRKDSCPSKRGGDNIHNFMDYSDDSCLTYFTHDQKSKMHYYFGHYRLHAH